MELTQYLADPFLSSAILSVLIFALAVLLRKSSNTSPLVLSAIAGALTAGWALLILSLTQEYVSGHPISSYDFSLITLMYGTPPFLGGAASGLVAHVALRALQTRPLTLTRVLLLVVPPLILLATTSCVFFASLMWATG